MPKPRVLLLANRWYADGGVENFIGQLVEETSDVVDYTIGSLTTKVDSPAKCRKYGPIMSSNEISRLFISGREIVSFMKSGHYNVVHIQASNGSAFYLTHLAQRAGISKRIVHSHNAGAEIDGSPVKRLVGKMTERVFVRSATDLWACSHNAGSFLFPKERFDVYRNGIDIDKFSFSLDARKKVRSRLGVGDGTFLLGSIGRIAYQKDPLFQVRVFAELRKLIPDAQFCMVGSGDMEEDLAGEICSLGLVNSVVRVSRTSEPQSFYSAFDALLFPSRFEGLSFVGIEGQCSGLPIYGSDALPYELGITELITFNSVDEGPAVWARRIAEGVGRLGYEQRFEYSVRLRQAGFDKKLCFEEIARSYGEGISGV